MPQGLVQPANAILYAGQPVVHEMEVKTATNMYPGRFVINDTAEYDVKIAGAASALVLGVLDVEPNELRSTIYGAGDQARVLSGDIVVMAQAASGSTIAVGTKLITAANGMVSEGSTAGQVVGYALQAKTGDDNEWILVKLTI